MLDQMLKDLTKKTNNHFCKETPPQVSYQDNSVEDEEEESKKPAENSIFEDDSMIDSTGKNNRNAEQGIADTLAELQNEESKRLSNGGSRSRQSPIVVQDYLSQNQFHEQISNISNTQYKVLRKHSMQDKFEEFKVDKTDNSPGMKVGRSEAGFSPRSSFNGSTNQRLGGHKSNRTAEKTCSDFFNLTQESQQIGLHLNSHHQHPSSTQNMQQQ